MALQKRGKTRFAFTLPPAWNGRTGIAYHQFDNNYQHALTAARKTVGADAIHHLSYGATSPRGDLQADARRRWERFMLDYDYTVRTMAGVIIDTMTEVNDLRKVAEWGRATQIPQMFYGSLYSDYRWMVRHALANDANVLFLHRQKDEYIQNERTGNLRLDGWQGIVYEAQMVLEHTRDEEGVFTTTIVEAAQDARLIGLTFTSADDRNDLSSIAAMVKDMA
jgi:hypothetical protein